MTLLDFFIYHRRTTANIAKRRLQIIVAEQRNDNIMPHYLPELKRDIIEVICKYVKIRPELFSVQLEKKDKELSILEFNITIPEIDNQPK